MHVVAMSFCQDTPARAPAGFSCWSPACHSINLSGRKDTDHSAKPPWSVRKATPQPPALDFTLPIRISPCLQISTPTRLSFFISPLLVFWRRDYTAVTRILIIAVRRHLGTARVQVSSLFRLAVVPLNAQTPLCSIPHNTTRAADLSLE
jgi:hypothetical protein